MCAILTVKCHFYKTDILQKVFQIKTEIGNQYMKQVQEKMHTLNSYYYFFSKVIKLKYIHVYRINEQYNVPVSH